jgi:hypothetical protein
MCVLTVSVNHGLLLTVHVCADSICQPWAVQQDPKKDARHVGYYCVSLTHREICKQVHIRADGVAYTNQNVTLSENSFFSTKLKFQSEKQKPK